MGVRIKCVCVCLFVDYCVMLYGVVWVVCAALVCVIVYRVLGCCACGLLCDEVCCVSFVRLWFVCLINMCGCCVRALLSDVVWLLLFVLLCLCVFM